MTENRRVYRELLGGLIKAAMEGVGRPAQAVYDYKPHDFAGKSPVVILMSQGSNRPVMTAQGRGAIFFFECWLLVLYKDEAGSYFEQEAEDILDDMEYALGDLVANYRDAQVALDFVERSQVQNMIVGGSLYLWEPSQIRLTVVK